MISRLRRFGLLLELTLIVVASVLATAQFLDPNPALKLPGREAEWLTSSAHFASLSLYNYGDIPLWQPYLNHGEPLLDNPFSMVLNPISSGPSLLVGGTIGVRWSVVLSTVLAGLGGWALARALGLGTLARLVLGLLMAGKGNMVGMIGTGYFQLGVSQAYMPWILAGTAAILRGSRRRVVIILTALMVALMFFAGNIYYLLPTLISVAVLALAEGFRVERRGRTRRLHVKGRALVTLGGAGLLALGLSAVTFLPIFFERGLIGGHSSDRGMGQYADLYKVVGRFFDSSYDIYAYHGLPAGPELYHSYILPLWFAALVFLLPPVIRRLLHRPLRPEMRSVWAVGMFMIFFFTLWGAGQNPVVGWLYDHSPLLGQWRFVGRMLAVASFWIAVLAALGVDELWRALGTAWRLAWLRTVCAALLAAVSLYASAQVLSQWKTYAGPDTFPEESEDDCIDWLRAENPDRPLAVWTRDYHHAIAYLRDQVRHAHITADFYVLPVRSTLFQGSLIGTLPEYAIVYTGADESYVRKNGYEPMADSVLLYGQTCFWRKADALPYAFTIPLIDLIGATNTLPVKSTLPVAAVARLPDRVALAVQSDSVRPLVAVAQEVAYPGWGVTVDGAPGQIESIGGLIGATVPADGAMHVVEFAYRPPLVMLGSAITLASALGCIVLLLDGDRAILNRRKRRRKES